MRRHQLLALLLLALAAASLLLLLQAEVEAGAEGSANYRHFMATLAASNTSATRSLGQCSIPPLEVVYNDLVYRKAFWPKVAARCKHEQPRLTYMEVPNTKYFIPFKKYFSSRYNISRAICSGGTAACWPASTTSCRARQTSCRGCTPVMTR